MKFIKKDFEAFRKDFEQAIEPVAEKYNLTIKLGNISYREDTFSARIECSKTDAGDLAKKEFIKYCSMYGLSPDDYMKEFVYGGEKYILTKISIKNPKYPCECKNIENGIFYKFTAEIIKKALERQI